MNRSKLLVASLVVIALVAGMAFGAFGMAFSQANAQVATPTTVSSAKDSTEGTTEAEVLPSSSMPRYITVVGQGKSSVEPDLAILDLGVLTSAETVGEGMAANTEAMEAVLAALKEAGVAEDDIRTSSFNIYLDEGYRGPDAPATATYKMNNMVSVKIRDMNNVAAVLDATVAAGVNQIWGATFSRENWDDAEDAARAEAMQDARERAEALAALAGVEVGEVVSISEVITGGNIPYARADMTMSAGMGGGGALTSPGQLYYVTSIQVTYALQ